MKSIKKKIQTNEKITFEKEKERSRDTIKRYTMIFLLGKNYQIHNTNEEEEYQKRNEEKCSNYVAIFVRKC